jgi:protoheme ferro-lyase
VLLHDGGPADQAPAVALAAALESRLVAHLAFPLGVAAATSRAFATVSDALARAAGVSLAVPLEPVWSRTGVAAYCEALAAAGRPDIEVVGGWQDDERYLHAVVAQAREALGDDRLDATAVLFVARGLPEEGGGEYYDLAQRLAARLVGLMAPGDWRLAFWDPEVRLPFELRDLLEWEWPTLLVVPIGRVLEVGETFELDARLRPAVEEAGRTYRRAGTAAGNPGFLAALADAVVDHLARRPLPGSQPDAARSAP